MNESPPRERFQFELSTLFVLTAFIAAVVLVTQPAKPSVLWGPLLFAFTPPKHHPATWFLTLALVATMALSLIKRAAWSAAVACLAALAWLLIGAMGMAIHW